MADHFNGPLLGGFPEAGLIVMGSSENLTMTKINQDLAVITAIFVFALSLGGAIMMAQHGAIKSCQDKGPSRCQVAAIRAW